MSGSWCQRKGSAGSGVAAAVFFRRFKVTHCCGEPRRVGGKRSINRQQSAHRQCGITRTDGVRRKVNRCGKIAFAPLGLLVDGAGAYLRYQTGRGLPSSSSVTGSTLLMQSSSSDVVQLVTTYSTFAPSPKPWPNGGKGSPSLPDEQAVSPPTAANINNQPANPRIVNSNAPTDRLAFNLDFIVKFIIVSSPI